MKKQYDFWYSKKLAQVLRESGRRTEHKFVLAEFFVDGEWHEYTEMITSGKEPRSNYDDMQKLGTGTTSDRRFDGRQRRGAK